MTTNDVNKNRIYYHYYCCFAVWNKYIKFIYWISTIHFSIYRCNRAWAWAWAHKLMRCLDRYIGKCKQQHVHFMQRTGGNEKKAEMSFELHYAFERHLMASEKRDHYYHSIYYYFIFIMEVSILFISSQLVDPHNNDAKIQHDNKIIMHHAKSTLIASVQQCSIANWSTKLLHHSMQHA